MKTGKIFAVISIAMILGVLSGCSRGSDSQSSCDSMLSLLAPSTTLPRLLQVTNVFLVGKFANVESTDSRKTGLMPEEKSCLLPAKEAAITEPKDVIFAIPELDGPIGKVAALAPGTRCREVEHRETVCDGKAGDGGASDAGCREVVVTSNTCKLPEWHYVIGDRGEQYAMFLFKDPENKERHLVLEMAFEVEDGFVDLGILEEGERTSLEDMRAYLTKNTKPGIPLFWEP